MRDKSSCIPQSYELELAGIHDLCVGIERMGVNSVWDLTG